MCSIWAVPIKCATVVNNGWMITPISSEAFDLLARNYKLWKKQCLNKIFCSKVASKRAEKALMLKVWP